MDSEWDWEWLWFCGHHIFKLTFEEFWSLTPRQLHTYGLQFTKYQIDVNGGKNPKRKGKGKQSSAPSMIYADQMFNL